MENLERRLADGSIEVEEHERRRAAPGGGTSLGRRTEQPVSEPIPQPMILNVDDVVAHYRRASEEGHLEALMESLEPDVELVSPLSGRMVFRGHEDVRVILGAVYGSLNGLSWTETLGEGRCSPSTRCPRSLGARG
jgi:hypothetical protein